MSLCEGGAFIQARSETKLRLQAATITRGEKTMRTMNLKSTMKALVLLAGMILAGTVVAFGQQQVNLTVTPTTTTLPDGTTVPMWGYFCGTAVTGSTATCGPLNPSSAGNPTAVPPVPATWSPVLITIPYSATGTNLTINLTNNLSFTPTGSTTPNNIPTSIVIVGQVGGGLGNLAQRTTTASPDHSNVQGCGTWFIAASNTPPGTPCTTQNPGASGIPPVQSARVQSFSTEAAVGTPVALNWPALRPGTYLLESGTHPSIQVPMGLIGMLVVTTPPSGATAGTAYPGVAGTTTTAIPAVQYNAEIPLEFSEIDPVQNKAVNTAVNTAGFSETMVWSGMAGQCGNPNSPVGVVNTCYPPAVNYTPFYYLIDGLAFNKTNAAFSLFKATAGVTATTPPVPVTTGIPATGTVLVRLVNAGLRMHVPSIVGSQTQGFSGAGVRTTVSGFALIAEDGNVIPNVAPAGATIVPAAPRVQTDVFMAAGKTFDAMINVPTPPTGATVPASLPVYDRELSLSANSSARDAGMLAYISVNAAGLPVTAGTGVFSAAKANTDTYATLVAGQVFSVTDPSKGVIANDVSVYGVNLLTGPANGTVTCNALPGTSAPGICANGTFTYTPTGTATSDSFTYCANNGFTPATGTTAASCSSANLTATVNLTPSNLTGNPVANNTSYTSTMSSFIKIASPGVLSVDSDPSNLPLQVVVSSVSSTTASVTMDPNGGFIASVPSCTVSTGCPVTFTYQAQNSQGRVSNTATVTLTFPTPSNLNVNVVDAQAYNNCNGAIACIVSLVPITDYRWIIEEDKTFWVDPNCTTNASSTMPGCPSIVGPVGTSTVPTFGVNFHASNMDFVAQGCTGPLSC